MSACDSKGFNLLRGPKGYLDSALSQSTSIGTKTCPWIMQAQQGQTIRLTLINFGRFRGSLPKDAKPYMCYKVATVKEKSKLNPIMTCAAYEKEKEVFRSRSNLQEFYWKTGVKDSMDFLLKYEGNIP